MSLIGFLRSGLCSSSTEVRKMARVAFSRLPLLPREAEPLSASSEVEKFIALAKEILPAERSLSQRKVTRFSWQPIISGPHGVIQSSHAS